MRRVAMLMQRWPRTSAMLSFCAVGTAFSTLWWGPLIFEKQSAPLFALFAGTPGLAAAIAGWICGKPFFDRARQRRPIGSAISGALIATFALLLFAPLFATLYVWTQPPTEHWSVLNLTLVILMGGALVAWLKIALVGAAVGWILHSVASYGAERTSA